MLLLAFLYNRSEREIVNECNQNLVFKYFLGLEVDDTAPDHSTLSRFRDRLGVEDFTAIFNKIVELARENGVVSDQLDIVDSTHMQVNVDVFKALQKASQDDSQQERAALSRQP